MNRIRCLIIDDEPLARELLAGYLSGHPRWQLVASCRSVTQAYETLCAEEVDVMFLDIRMPEVSGIDFLRSLKKPPLVVFTTAFSEYAVEAFQLHAVDYLLKPITVERFGESIARIEAMLDVKAEGPRSADHFFVRQDSRMVKLMFDDILYIEALKDFSKIHLRTKKMLLSAHLKLLEAQLPSTRFLRVHRSYIVSLAAITAVQGATVEIGTVSIPVGTTYRDQLMNALGL